MSVSSTEHLDKLAFILYDRPSGRNIIGYAIEEIEKLRADLATQQGCCDGAAAQDAHIRREREEHRAQIERLCAENERLRDVLRRVFVYPSGDRMVKISFVSVGCMVTYPVCPQTTWALELMIDFEEARRNALEGKP